MNRLQKAKIDALSITPPKLKNGQDNVIVRDEHGRIVSGALNPGGRSYKRLIRQVLTDELELGKAEPLAKELLRLGLKGRHESARIAAIQTVIEHTEGKAVQRSLVGISVDPNTLERLADIADRLALE